MKYDDALRALYQTPHDRFVAERKRLADELRAGDRAAAARLAQLARPTISAWVVNQLYWHARDAFDEMLASAARLREGDLGATAAHRDTISRLRQRAATMLADAGNAASETTLRRVTTNLSAIAAIGSFEPDPPGALAADRAAPGFAAVGDVVAGQAPSTATKSEPNTREESHTHEAAAKHRADEEEQRRREEQRRAEELERLRAERGRVAVALRTAKRDLGDGESRVRALEHELRAAEAAVAKLRAIVEDLERKLAGLERVAND